MKAKTAANSHKRTLKFICENLTAGVKCLFLEMGLATGQQF